MLHFRSLMNDYHLKDLSNKIKSVLLSRKKSGLYASAQTPYGYRKSEDGTKLIIDETSATVMRRIFDMRYQGMAYGKIAAALNRDGVLAPRAYMNTVSGKTDSKASGIWLCASVKNILNSEVYLGTMILNYTGTLSYKNDQIIRKPESEWIRREGAHEAIVSRDVWDVVQKINSEAKKRASWQTPNTPKLFTRKLICADCRGKLVASTSSRKQKNGIIKRYVTYCCSKFLLSGRCVCSCHSIGEITLKRIVMSEVKEKAQALVLDEAGVMEKLGRRLVLNDGERLKEMRQEIAKLRRRIKELENTIAKLYEDKLSGIINESTFLTLVQKSEQERIGKAERLDALLSEIYKAEQNTADIHKWAAAVRKYYNIQELNRDIIDKLIDHIEIGERTIVDGVKHQKIKIFYRFVGPVS